MTQREKELEKGGEIPEKFIQRITELAKLIPVTKSVHSSASHRNLSNLDELFKQKHL